MNPNNLYIIEGLTFSQISKTQIYIIPESSGLKLIDPLNLTFKLMVQWCDEEVILDWNDYLQGTCANVLYFELFNKGDKYKIEGSAEQLTELYNICKGKFIFKKSTIYKVNSIIQTNSQYEISVITDLRTNKQYIEKKILSNVISNRMDISNSFHTDFGLEQIPEEVKIIQLLNIQRCPYILQILAICFDGEYYSYIYTTQNQISLKQILQKEPIGLALSFFIEIAEQMLIVLNIFRELKIIYNGITLDMINYSKDTNSVVFNNFSYSTLERNKIITIKGNSVGSIPPEYLSNQYLISTQANVYQLGILFYKLLFKLNPFGNDQQTQLQNNILGKYTIPNTNIDKEIIALLKSMMQINPKNRKTPKQYLCSKVFTPQYRSKISKTSLLNVFTNNHPPLKIDEFEVENEITIIQNIRFLTYNKKQN